MKWLLCALGLVVIFVGCETPYTGFLGPGDIDKYVDSTGDNTVCIADGFDSICIQTIPGPRGPQGLQGLQGEDGETIIGPRGEPGQQGEPGTDGAVVYLELVKIVTETEFVRVPVFVEVPVFVLEVSKTETAYSTPIGEVYVPENAPIVVPDDIEVTPVPEPVPTPVPTPVPEPVTTPDLPPIEDGEIWHVMYRNDNGQITTYVYPRARDIQTVPPLEISKDFGNEIQGTKEQVNFLLERALEEENATLVDVGGVQGVVN